jgi:hypothetical protein
MPISRVSAMLYSTDSYAAMVFVFFKPHAMLFDLARRHGEKLQFLN